MNISSKFESFVQNFNEKFFGFWERFAKEYPALIWLIVIILPYIEALLPFLPLIVIVGFNIQILTPLFGPILSPIFAVLLSAIGSF